jgi:hypothetical protein
MTDTKIYLELSDEIQGILADNGLSIEDILQQEAVEATVSHGVAPYQSEEGARTKEVVTIILASSVAVAAIGFAISQVLNSIHDKPYFVEYDEPVELRDENGKVLKDREGKPIFKKIKRHELLEPRKNNRQTDFDAEFNPANGVVLKFGTKEE